MIEPRYDDRGLVVAIAQDRLTGRVQMVAWMNREALEATRRTAEATFFSRSRGRLWKKGEESGHVLRVHEIAIDCDADAILLLVDPVGPSCHTGAETCFFTRDDGAPRTTCAAPILVELSAEIEARKSSDGGKSYTKSLLDGGAAKIGEKLREEADELARALEGESNARVASEAADVVYHLLVGLAHRGVEPREVLAELTRRRGRSGHEEKAARATE